MISTRSGPFVTSLIALNIIVYSVLLVSQTTQAAFVSAGFVPIMITAGEWFVGPIPPVLSPLTAAFIHDGPLHVLLNMLMLFVCGKATEAALGWRGCLVLYGIGAYAAAMAQWAWDPQSLMPMVGASGAVSAIVGAYAAIFSEQKVAPIGPIPGHIVRLVWLAVAWTVIQALFGIAFSGAGQGTIAVAAHIGGFLAGVLLARPLLRWKYRPR